jgi:hypothetical protein
MGGIALYHLHEVGDQIGTALVLVEHLRPGGIDLLIVDLDLVIAAT